MVVKCLVVLTLLTFSSPKAIWAENETVANNDILNWQPPEYFITKYPFYHAGYDYENRPVLVMQWGKWRTRSVVENGGQELVDIRKAHDLLVERLRTSFYRKPTNNSETGLVDDEFVAIMDLKGFDLFQLASIPHIKYQVEFFSKFEKVYEKFAYGFVINASAVAKQFITLYNAFMAKFAERTEFYGTNPKVWIPRLLRQIPRDQLPLEYGGTSSFKPVAFYG